MVLGAIVANLRNRQDDLDAALREKAKLRRTLAQKGLSSLEARVPVPQELGRRHQLVHKALRMSSKQGSAVGRFQSTEEIRRADRAR